MRRMILAAAVAAGALCAAGQALAWGATGHRMVGRAAMEALPPEIPPFLRTRAAAEAIGELAREPDRSRDVGRAHDADRDPGHFVDGGDDGKIAGVISFDALPLTRDDYETALRAAGTSSWKMGYLPYSIITGWQQLAKDFANWRADVAGIKHTRNAQHRAWMLADKARREALILADLGALAHFVGDGSQPLHGSVHYNGWGDHPNPAGYTQDHIHTPFEGAFVRDHVAYGAVTAGMRPFQDCGCPIDRRVGAYLADDVAAVIPLYELQKGGAFAGADPRGVAFATRRLALGASELRDEIVLAWRAAGALKVGWAEVDLSAIESGQIADPYDNLIGTD